jgi:hypothetical protein
MDPALRYAAEFHIPPILDLIAIILFAITGALSAAKRGYDWIGAMSIALVTGSGGGLPRARGVHLGDLRRRAPEHLRFPARFANALDFSRG